MKVNFRKIPFQDIEGNEQMFDIQKGLGNTLYMQGANIEECKLGERIYGANGEVELSDDDVAVIKRFASGYSFVLREAIEAAMKKQ